MSLDNTALQYAATQRPVVNTTKSFAVSAWLKPDGSATSPTRNFTAVSTRGEQMSGFYLKYVEANDTWVFARTARDIHSSGDEGWYQATWRQGVHTDEWTHVVGVYDAIDQRLKIYVNGEKGEDSARVTSPWSATGPLEIGRAQWDAGPADYWAGEIDDVSVYDRIVGAGEVEEMVTRHPDLKGRWKFNSEGCTSTECAGETKTGVWTAPGWVEALEPGRVKGYGTPEEVLR
ncbi:LamG domain-containing protein [Actinomadura adrarensis]|uniref:LamG domain-containing protein n=1 Tax=Actinomadura adrarensis TaxID=1819600 RepID=A0ABW3CI39_9ACTN